MSIYIAMALLGGFVGLSRLINGYLGVALGLLRASFWNHLVGLLFLKLQLNAMGRWPVVTQAHSDVFEYLGGVSDALSKLGATRTTCWESAPRC
jgi:transporter family-2 protein